MQRLAYMQRQRHWVERAFQEAKNEAGLDEYQARSWQAWYHHAALVMMALLLLLRERQLQKEALPLLSAGISRSFSLEFYRAEIKIPRRSSGRCNCATNNGSRASTRPIAGEGSAMESDKVELRKLSS